MVTINYDNTIYTGRLISIQAIEQSFLGEDGRNVIKNAGYDVVIMDAFGAIIYVLVDDLSCISWS